MALFTETAIPGRIGLEDPTMRAAMTTVRREVAFLHNDPRIRKLILDNAETPGALIVDSRKVSEEGPRILVGDELERELKDLTNTERIDGMIEFSRLRCNETHANNTYGVKSLQKRIDRSKKMGWRSIYAAIAKHQYLVEEIISAIFQTEPHLFIIHKKSIDIYDLAGRGIRIDHEDRPFVTLLESGYQEGKDENRVK